MPGGSLQARTVASLRNDGPAVTSARRAAGGTGASLSARCAGPVGTRPPAPECPVQRRADGEGARTRAGWLRGQDPQHTTSPDDRVNLA